MATAMATATATTTAATPETDRIIRDRVAFLWGQGMALPPPEVRWEIAAMLRRLERRGYPAEMLAAVASAKFVRHGCC